MSIASSAQQGASLTGLPVAFVQALIQAEQGEAQLATTNNPFDVTQTWANLTGFGSYVTGLWNSVGVATFSSQSAAVQAWALGINTFSNYAQFRADFAKGASVLALAEDLQAAGYAGTSGTYANLVSSIYQSLTGQAANASLVNAPPASSGGLSTIGGTSVVPWLVAAAGLAVILA